MVANHPDVYWTSRGVPALPADVLKLNKGQRKAWRTRYLQDLYIPDGLVGNEEEKWRLQNTVQRLTGSEPQSIAVPLRSVPSRPRPDGSPHPTSTSQKVAKKTTDQIATLNVQLGITRLCVPPKKVWHNVDGSLWRPAMPCRNAVEDDSSGGGSTDEARNPSLTPAVSKPKQDTILQPSPKRQKTRHVVYPPAMERRLSSIPDNLGWSSGAETFRRFSAIVDCESESDVDVSDSSSEDEMIIQPVLRGSVAESFAEQINEGSPTVQKASPSSQLQAALQDAIMNGEDYILDEQGRSTSTLPLRNNDRPPEGLGGAPLPTKTADHLADAIDAAHEVISLSSNGGSKNGSKAYADSEIASPLQDAVCAKRDEGNFNLDAEESTQEVYEAVEQVLEDVCSSTRALPSSRSTRSRIRKDPLMTKTSSRSSELVPEPVVVLPHTATALSENAVSDDEGSMAEVGEEAGEADMDGESTGSTANAGSNIVVAQKSMSGPQADGQDEEMQDAHASPRPSLKSSSSALEELSRSPSPPPTLVKSQVPSAITSETKKSRSVPASPRVIVTRLSASKRKMTGVTSKHFSSLELDRDVAAAVQQRRRQAVKDSSKVAKLDNQEKSQAPARVDMRLINEANGSEDDDVIVVASRCQSPQSEGLAQKVHAAQNTVSRRTRSNPRPASPVKNRSAYVDLTDFHSNKQIAYVDLTGVPRSPEEKAPLPSPPNDHDEPLDHLEKLLAYPNSVKQSRPLSSDAPPSSAPAERDASNADPVTPKRTLKKSTGTKSPHFITDRVDLYNTTSSSRRVPAGTSTVPFPALTDPTFGIIQEKLWQEPFWLLIAVTFLNKTTGRAAVPVFWKVKKLFPTPQELAKADPEILLEMVKTLGLQNARSKRLVTMAQAWVACPPVKGISFRTLNYPCRGDGRASEVPEMLEGDMEVCKGSLEIGHIPGCGAYAYDSWRIFCRDVLRDVAEDYDGKGVADEDFEAEWKRVLPADKELRACLRWMWLREGWVWNPLTGEKRLVEEGEDFDALAVEQIVERVV